MANDWENSSAARHNNGFVYGAVLHCQDATACM